MLNDFLEWSCADSFFEKQQCSILKSTPKRNLLKIYYSVADVSTLKYVYVFVLVYYINSEIICRPRVCLLGAIHKCRIFFKHFDLPPTFSKFIYSEKATKFCEISTLLLSYVVSVRSKVEISQNFVAFSEYMNFNQTEVQVDFASTISLFTIVT